MPKRPRCSCPCQQMSLRVVKSCQHLQPMWPVIASLRNPVRLSDTPEPIGTDTWRWPALPAASTCAHSGRNKENQFIAIYMYIGQNVLKQSESHGYLCSLVHLHRTRMTKLLVKDVILKKEQILPDEISFHILSLLEGFLTQCIGITRRCCIKLTSELLKNCTKPSQDKKKICKVYLSFRSNLISNLQF